jgi:general secretion pathway protein M
MMKLSHYKRYLAQLSVFAFAYGATVVVLFAIAIVSLASAASQYAQRNDVSQMLNRLETRARNHSSSPGTGGASNSNAAFIGGASATIASATLLQRVTGAITRADGSILSSEIGEQTARQKNRELKASASFEINQNDLQRVLFDIEAGLPFLIIDQLNIDAQKSSGSNNRLRVVMEISGSWRGRQ